MFIPLLHSFSSHNDRVVSERCRWHPAAPGHIAYPCRVTAYNLSHLVKLKEHFCTEEKEQDP